MRTGCALGVALETLLSPRREAEVGWPQADCCVLLGRRFGARTGSALGVGPRDVPVGSEGGWLRFPHRSSVDYGPCYRLKA